ncbi:hypothetical protein LJR220_004818 [Bradyrhizobium sp. LjRoot220]|uniref:hypothetical protein n=1 Tax=Bradyrhizobium sp. LjRoot220 TaxID=3342284 RepID=UPI003ED0AF24
MNQPAIFDNDIRALQEWLRSAWKQLADPSLTTFMRRELRNQMKQCSADLRSQLQLEGTRQSEQTRDRASSFSKPQLRILT